MTDTAPLLDEKSLANLVFSLRNAANRRTVGGDAPTRIAELEALLYGSLLPGVEHLVGNLTALAERIQTMGVAKEGASDPSPAEHAPTAQFVRMLQQIAVHGFDPDNEDSMRAICLVIGRLAQQDGEDTMAAAERTFSEMQAARQSLQAQRAQADTPEGSAPPEETTPAPKAAQKATPRKRKTATKGSSKKSKAATKSTKQAATRKSSPQANA